MRSLDLNAAASSLRDVDPDDLAAALYADPDPKLLLNMIDAVAKAAEHRAYFPHQDVIEAGDAALYTVLTWPIADALPPGRAIPNPERLGAIQGTSAREAREVLDRIAATETLAAQTLVGSGVEITFTREQACISYAIHDLLSAGTTPTRASVRSYALDRAGRGMRGGEAPIIRSTAGLPPRIVSPSPYALVPGWLDRMYADPPGARLLDHDLAYIADAWAVMGRSARGVARLRAAHGGDPHTRSTAASPAQVASTAPSTTAPSRVATLGLAG